jgi:3',5'-cyclic AMP phosphodiesterase CpdA
MRFAHISDFHFTDSATDFRHIRDDVLEALPKLFADLRSIEGYLDFIAITGDVVESGDVPSYLKVREFLGMFKVPVFFGAWEPRSSRDVS